MLHSFPPTVVCPSFTAIVTSYPGVNTEENADVDVILPSIFFIRKNIQLNLMTVTIKTRLVFPCLRDFQNILLAMLIGQEAGSHV